MTVCQFCGAKLMDGAKFCYKCERKLEYPDEKDTVSGGMKDSVAVRAPGAGSVYAPSITLGKNDKCPSCGTPITDRNRGIKCSECGTSFCASCELDFRTERKPAERPYCSNCFAKHQELIKEERLRKDEQERVRQAEEKKKESEKEIIENSIGMKMKLIPAGEFMMGDGSYKHKVKLTKPFYIGIYQVTQKEWQAVMGNWEHESYCENPRKDDQPICCVSWHDCQEFIGALNKKEGGWKYRLPTEAEWEYTCRAGSTTKYCFGDNDSQLSGYAWFDANSNDKTHPVGIKRPNNFGLHDMHGNVWEWCQDNWHDDYNGAPTDGGAWEPGSGEDGSYRVFRGGSWCYAAENCRSADRNRCGPGYRGSNLGLRLVRSL